MLKHLMKSIRNQVVPYYDNVYVLYRTSQRLEEQIEQHVSNSIRNQIKLQKRPP